MTGRLVGRKAIVTGASQGLGLAIASEFLAQGADVLICARGAGELASAAAHLKTRYPHRQIESLRTDVALSADVDAVFDRALQSFGDLQVVVNNAGVHGPIGPLEEVDLDAWIQAIEINLLGVVHSCRRALRHFKQRGYGKIINLSGGGATSPQPGLAAYGASKAAVVRLTETLALEAAHLRIDVNAVAPGALATRLMAELKAAGPERIGQAYYQKVEASGSTGTMPLERAANLCAYLGSSASDGLSGRLLSAVWDPWPFDVDRIRDIMASDIYSLRRITPEDRGLSWSL